MRPAKELEDRATHYQGEIVRLHKEIGFGHRIEALLREFSCVGAMRRTC
jgi:hypothetical protein